MNKFEFMKQLENLLQDISPAERESALQYYEDYFHDAGVENEQSVIKELGSPEKVAENIKRDLYGSSYEDNRNQDRRTEYSTSEYWQEYTKEDKEQEKDNKMSTGLIILLIILGVLASPVLISLVTGIFGIVIGVIASWFSLILVSGVAAVALLALMLCLLIVGTMCIFTSTLTGIALIGGGLVCGGIGLLFLMLAVAMIGIVTPAICKGIAKLWCSLFQKKKII